jgi:hypothetical protein
MLPSRSSSIMASNALECRIVENLPSFASVLRQRYDLSVAKHVLHLLLAGGRALAHEGERGRPADSSARTRDGSFPIVYATTRPSAPDELL